MESLEIIALEIKNKIGICGKIICGSKSGYHRTYPRNLVAFNANIIINDAKIWYGDIDVTLSGAILKEIAINNNVDIYVLREMDARFENEFNPKIENAMVIYFEDGNVKYNEGINVENYDNL